MSWIFIISVLLLLPRRTDAVPPPDFIFNVGAGFAQVFSFGLIFLSAAASVLLKFLKSFSVKYVVLGLVIAAAVSGGAAYFYGQYRQNTAYQNWLQQSANVARETPPPSESSTAALDKLDASATSTPPRPTSRFTSNLSADGADDVMRFIERYYREIADRNIAGAYALSKKSVPFETFKSWYANVTALTLDQLTRIDTERSSLELTLYEGRTYTRYGVLMTLAFENGTPVRVAASEVRELTIGSVEAGSGSTAMSNEEFRTIGADALVLDARENVENEYGRYPGSRHIRFADLVAGRWIELPRDQTVVVLCWSGMRGREVAEFLRGKGIAARYLESGAKGWVDAGGAWDGEIDFIARFPEPHYNLVFTTDEFRKKQREGIFVVDSREPWKFARQTIPGSVNIPIIYTPTAELEAAFAQVPPGSSVITVCDEFVNCFDAKITGVELEKRGSRFLGRYGFPWEY